MTTADMKKVEMIARAHSENPNKPTFNFTVAEIAPMLGHSKRYVKAWIKERGIPPYSASKSKRYDLFDVMAEFWRPDWRDTDRRGRRAVGA